MTVNLINREVSFIYTNKKNKTTFRQGIVVPNAPTVNQLFITLKMGDTETKSFDLTRVMSGTFRIL